MYSMMDSCLSIDHVYDTDICHVMQGICHLLTNIGIYCKETISSCSSYELRRVDDSGNDLESLSEYENMDLNLVFKKINEEMEARKRATEQVSFHLHLPKELSTLVEGSSILVKHVFVFVITLCCFNRRLMVILVMIIWLLCNFSLTYC